jgi:hypothetical protein
MLLAVAFALALEVANNLVINTMDLKRLADVQMGHNGVHIATL